MVNTRNNNQGVIAILALMAVSVFALTVITTVSLLAVTGLRNSSATTVSEHTFNAAEAGINEGLYRSLISPGARTFSLNSSVTGGPIVVVSIDPADLSDTCGDPSQFKYVITSTATDTTGKKRELTLKACTNSFAGGFDAAVQVGDGGIVMENNSAVRGGCSQSATACSVTSDCPIGESCVVTNIYSNGTINGNNGASIDGSTWVAGANTLDNLNIAGSAYAHSISGGSNMSLDAYYTSIDNNSKASGVKCSTGTNVHCHPGTPDPAPRNLPITDSMITNWENAINPGNILNPNGGSCPANTYCITTASSLGNVIVNGDLYVQGDVALTITDTVWVKGKITFGNSGNGSITVNVPNSGSAVMIADDGNSANPNETIDISNNYNVLGSSLNSFLLMISMSTNMPSSPTPYAIYASNGSTSLVLAAPHGSIRVKNGGEAKAMASRQLYLLQTSKVIYNPNLRNFYIPPSGGNAITPQADTWTEQ